jgi:hypothetical protein
MKATGIWQGYGSQWPSPRNNRPRPPTGSVHLSFLVHSWGFDLLKLLCLFWKKACIMKQLFVFYQSMNLYKNVYSKRLMDGEFVWARVHYNMFLTFLSIEHGCMLMSRTNESHCALLATSSWCMRHEMQSWRRTLASPRLLCRPYGTMSPFPGITLGWCWFNS